MPASPSNSGAAAHSPILTASRISASIAAAAERAGYLAACTLRFVHSEDEPYRRPRVGLSGADVGVRLHAQLSSPALSFRKSVAARSLRRIPRSRSWLPRADETAIARSDPLRDVACVRRRRWQHRRAPNGRKLRREG